VLFFARLYSVQGHLGWPADSKTTLDLQDPTGSLPSLGVLGLAVFSASDRSDWSPGFLAGEVIAAIRAF